MPRSVVVMAFAVCGAATSDPVDHLVTVRSAGPAISNGATHTTWANPSFSLDATLPDASTGATGTLNVHFND
jgi:hypothetical protein